LKDVGGKIAAGLTKVNGYRSWKLTPNAWKVGIAIAAHVTTRESSKPDTFTDVNISGKEGGL
jgi:hypothetical protein